MCVAPATANIIAKLANGIADDLLTTTALACTAPLVLAPAMNVHMYEAAATRYNIGKLGIRGACSSRPIRDTWHVAMWDAAVWPTCRHRRAHARGSWREARP